MIIIRFNINSMLLHWWQIQKIHPPPLKICLNAVFSEYAKKSLGTPNNLGGRHVIYIVLNSQIPAHFSTWTWPSPKLNSICTILSNYLNYTPNSLVLNDYPFSINCFSTASLIVELQLSINNLVLEKKGWAEMKFCKWAELCHI